MSNVMVPVMPVVLVVLMDSALACLGPLSASQPPPPIELQSFPDYSIDSDYTWKKYDEMDCLESDLDTFSVGEEEDCATLCNYYPDCEAFVAESESGILNIGGSTTCHLKAKCEDVVDHRSRSISVKDYCYDMCKIFEECKPTRDGQGHTCVACPLGTVMQFRKCLGSDDDECTEDTHNCHDNAVCTNTDGSFTCVCKDDFTGDGVEQCSAHCEEGWRRYNGVCWYMSTEFLDPNDSRSDCQSMGAEMGMPNSQEDYEFMRDYASELGGEIVYFGLVYNHMEGNWTFVDGSKPDYIPWLPNYPTTDVDCPAYLLADSWNGVITTPCSHTMHTMKKYHLCQRG